MEFQILDWKEVPHGFSFLSFLKLKNGFGVFAIMWLLIS
jgi:hypothetical protein